jgi:murein DD-endopeptidase MepM/ murein hydrolase activator NlpD
MDVAFYRHGEPVRAIANGRVTYADPEGWDTEKGVVIVEHSLPDGSRVYSLYGHMEPIGDYFFPGVGQCVTPGQIVGAVGDPSLSAPHLHFEIRVMLPDDGGPGYWDTNPLEAGWLNPLDFVRLWQLRLAGTEEDAASPMSATSAACTSPACRRRHRRGQLIVADGSMLEGVTPGETTPASVWPGAWN